MASNMLLSTYSSPRFSSFAKKTPPFNDAKVKGPGMYESAENPYLKTKVGSNEPIKVAGLTKSEKVTQ